MASCARNPQTIGYPISQRQVDGTHTLQALQKAILPWDPNQGRMKYHNTLGVGCAAGSGGGDRSVRGMAVPRGAGSGGLSQ